jgi:hypothetical protein
LSTMEVIGDELLRSGVACKCRAKVRLRYHSDRAGTAVPAPLELWLKEGLMSIRACQPGAPRSRGSRKLYWLKEDL